MKILVVDDEKKFARVLAERLKLRGFDTAVAFDGASALSALQTDHYHGMVLDLRLPDMDGSQVLRQTRTNWPEVTVVVLSGHATRAEFDSCLKLGAAACFQKPAKIAEVAKVLTDLQD